MQAIALAALKLLGPLLARRLGRWLVCRRLGRKTDAALAKLGISAEGRDAILHRLGITPPRRAKPPADDGWKDGDFGWHDHE